MKKYEALWDSFKEIYVPVSEREVTAPPERYVYCSTYEGAYCYVESFERARGWYTEKCDVAYTDEEIENQSLYSRGKYIAMKRDEVFKKDWDGIRLVSWKMPFEVFKSQVEKCGLTMDELEDCNNFRLGTTWSAEDYVCESGLAPAT